MEEGGQFQTNYGERQNKGQGGKIRRNRRRWKREDNSRRIMEKDKIKEEEEEK